ncbi:MAG: hypothetical protein QOJ13_3394 [Gaiellales bacterium]|jgi:hypothetical protein|nr:hypothetical protein [Gaiellales bacterium]MDX6594198.1 hypothetical protein [Gaiellales bacterium]
MDMRHERLGTEGPPDPEPDDSDAVDIGDTRDELAYEARLDEAEAEIGLGGPAEPGGTGHGQPEAD